MKVDRKIREMSSGKIAIGIKLSGKNEALWKQNILASLKSGTAIIYCLTMMPGKFGKNV